MEWMTGKQIIYIKSRNLIKINNDGYCARTLKKKFFNCINYFSAINCMRLTGN